MTKQDQILLVVAAIVLLLAVMVAVLLLQMKRRHRLLQRRDEIIADETEKIETLTRELAQKGIRTKETIKFCET
ncbi:MAG: hypothetical protein IJ588_00675 [Prevotella sp.]|nr:hypothetical protein [Prevotella sp.]